MDPVAGRELDGLDNETIGTGGASRGSNGWVGDSLGEEGDDSRRRFVELSA